MTEQGDRTWARLPSVRIGAVVAIALAAGLLVWLIVRGNDDSSSSSTTGQTTTTAAAARPVAATPATLSALADEVGHPVYWVGPRQNRTYELTRTSNGRIFIRYLPPDAEIGNRERPLHDRRHVSGRKRARGSPEALDQPGEKSAPAPGGGLAVYSTTSPNNVYVAYPGSDVQIEVFDPSAKRALRLVTSGRVAPVG